MAGAKSFEPGLELCSLQPAQGAEPCWTRPCHTLVTRLFHPRKDRWSEHFAWQAANVLGLTPIGRTTVQVLAMNEPSMVAVREALIVEGCFPPALSFFGCCRSRFPRILKAGTEN